MWDMTQIVMIQANKLEKLVLGPSATPDPLLDTIKHLKVERATAKKWPVQYEAYIRRLHKIDIFGERLPDRYQFRPLSLEEMLQKTR